MENVSQIVNWLKTNLHKQQFRVFLWLDEGESQLTKIKDEIETFMAKNEIKGKSVLHGDDLRL